jgi:Bacterial Ig-like domain (group 3)
MYAGMLLPLVLLASTPNPAQQIARSTEPPKSIISLAPASRPQGEILARHTSDSTFQHAPASYHVFAAATVGEDAGVEALMLNFAGETTLTGIASKNKDFVIEPGGTCHEGNSYARGGSCALLVRFNPQGPGHRLGFINITHLAEATPMSFGLTGNGYAPVVSFTPSLITTVPGSANSGTGTIKSSTHLAIDGGDILYVADTGNNRIKEMDSSGALISDPFVPTSTPASIAVDSLGNVYTINTPGSADYFTGYGAGGSYGNPWTWTPGTCTPSAHCFLSIVGMDQPVNLSIDANDNLFFTDQPYGAVEMLVPVLTGIELWYLRDISGSIASSFAVDAYGNLYTSHTNYLSDGICRLLEEPLYDAETTSQTSQRVAGGLVCGFSGDGGQARGAEISSIIGQMAFDIAGNLYFADAGNQRIRRIDKLTGIISTIAGNGAEGYTGDGGAATAATLSNPSGVGVDSQGQVYILSNAPAIGPTQAIRKVGVTGYVNFGAHLKGSTSAPTVVTVANSGNDTLTLASAAYFNGANPSSFAIDPNTTTCVLTAGATLSAGRSCKLGIVFTPSSPGNFSANLVLLDNSVTSTNTIQLVGTGTPPPLLPATITITSPILTSPPKAGVAFTFAASVTSMTSAIEPTGTVTFAMNGITVGSPVTLSSSGTASESVTESATGHLVLSATYSGDTSYATASTSETVTVSAIKMPVTVSLIPAASPASTCGAVGFSVQVSSIAGGSPTGVIELKSGSSVLASTTLRNGDAMLSAGVLAAGSHTFTAIYSGDSLHQPATSASISVIVPPVGSSCVGGYPPTVGVTSQRVVR